MRRSRGARWAYAAAALVTLALTALWAQTLNYTCPDTDGSGSYVCDGQGGVEMVTRTIVAVLGLCLTGWFAYRALRRTTPRNG